MQQQREVPFNSQHVPFHYPFWTIFHAVLILANGRFAALYFAPDRPSFWLALAVATAQGSLVGLILLLLWEGIGKRFIKTSRADLFFYGGLGLLAALYLSDFIYYRITGTGLSLLFTYLWRLSPADIRDMFTATRISTANLLLIAAFTMTVPAALWGTTWVALRLSRRRPLNLSSRLIVAAALASFAVMAAGQWIAKDRLDTYRWHLFSRSLPVYLPVFGNAGDALTMAVHVRPYERLDHRAAALPISGGQLPRDLSVFVVIAETIRQDFVTEEISPHLHAFQERNLSFRHAFCSGNTTHYSWFSILFGAYPIYWNAQRRGAEQLGSPALQILKKAGFKIHLYTKQHHLRYLGFGDLCFGKELRLVDDAVIAPDLEVAETDGESVNKLTGRIRGGLPPGRHLYILFLDSTHHNYFFPKNYPAPFRPYAEDFSYLKWDYSPRDLDGIRNRYRNALHYMDSLFGRIIGALRETGAYEKSFVGIVADHGEEFMEHGSLIHGSNFFDPQVRVPICFKTPEGRRQRVEQTIAGVDFFPTLLDLLGLYDQSRTVLQGRSAMDTDCRHLAVLAQNHADADPFEYALFNGTYKVVFRLDARSPLHSRDVLFIRAYDDGDRPVSFARGGDSLDAFLRRHFWPVMQDMPFVEFRNLR